MGPPRQGQHGRAAVVAISLSRGSGACRARLTCNAALEMLRQSARCQARTVSIDPASVDTNHAERDKHLRGSDFLDVTNYPGATFESTTYTGDADRGTLEGILTLHGVTKPISIRLEKLGEGNDHGAATALDSSAPPP